jgi:uncharacterized protein YdcH (DUF465 family)
MEELIRRIAERFPGKSSVIKTLSGTNARFKDLITDHFTVNEELASRVAADPAHREELEKRRSNLEEELRMMMEDQQRV